MLIKDAIRITGGVTTTSKMPSKSYSLDARDCNVGSKLVKVQGSVCANCYALKGNYIRYQTAIQKAQARRLEGLINNSQWVTAMVRIIGKDSYFRWFDSGDIPDMKSLIKIVSVAMLTPNTKHWLPTKEYQLISSYKRQGGFIPNNLVIRQSAPMLDVVLPAISGTSSMVVTYNAKLPKDTVLCSASKQGNQCLDCRACWTPEVLRVAYPSH